MNRVLIWGSGAIGGTIGAYLVDAGIDVNFVDQEQAHVDAMNKSGLHITGPIREFTVPARAFTPAELTGSWDVIILATKSQHTRKASEQLAPFLSGDGVVVSAQNGLNEVEIAAVIGWPRTFGAFVNFGADYLEPGKILYGGRGAVYLGEMDGSITERGRQLFELFRKFEPDTVLTDNLLGYLWAKLAYGAMLFATALTNASIADAFAEEKYQDYFVDLAREVLQVASLEGITPEPFDGFTPADFLQPEVSAARVLQPMIEFNRRSAKTHSGIWRDLAVRKRPTEADAQLGPIVSTAEKHGSSAPLTSRIIELIHGIERGEVEMGWETLDAATDARGSHVS